MSIETRAIASLRLHPDAGRVPRPCAADRAALRSGLSEAGQEDPIDITDDGQILDGRTRWELLADLGALDIQVRVHDLPAADQTAYIVKRAVDRRHLTSEQKRDLNALLRVQVVEERATKRGNEMRIGYGQGERAAKLGVDTTTIQRWDAEPSLVTPDGVTRPLPTHAIDKLGRPQPIHKARTPAERPKADRPAPLRKARSIPSWSRHFSTWCRNASRPEDRVFLRRLDRELHAALKANGIECQERETP